MKEEYKLHDMFKITALESIMAVGQAKLYFENIKIQGGGFDGIVQKCKEYALRRRIEHGHKKHKDDMDVDRIERDNTSEDNWGFGGDDPWAWGYNAWDMDMFAKGKGKGYGYEGKGKGYASWDKGKGKGKDGYKGKGKGKEGCKGKGYSMEEKGKGKGKAGQKGKGKGFQGICFNSGQPGHPARECQDMNPFQGH